MSKAVKGLIAVVVLAIIAVAAFFAFGNKQDAKDTAKVGNLNVAYNNDKKAISGGDLKVAEVSDTPFQGSYLSPLQDDMVTSNMFAPTGSGIFYNDKSFKIIDSKDAPANVKLDDKAKTATITLNKNLKWSDGKQVTAKDYEFTYELIAKPAYGSDRWSTSLANIEGLSAFHSGKADKISGITYPDGADGKTVKIQFKKMTPGMTNSGNGYYLESVSPYHYLKDIKPKDLVSSKANTTKPLVWGAWAPKKIVAGQSILYTPNKYYYGDKPKFDTITYEIVSTSKIVAALKAHKYDFTTDNIANLYPQIKKISGYTTTGQTDLYISLKYFNLGHYDEAKGENVMDRKSAVSDVKVRQAMAYALNIEQVNKKFNNGLKTRAKTLVPPIFKDAYDSSLKGFPEDTKKANKLLDEAGWKLNKKTGIREKDGKELALTYLARSGNATSEAVAQNNIQQWKKIGIKVSLYNGRLQDFNTWAELVQANDNKWDITDAAWGLSSEPSQQDLFSKEAPFNYGHFTSDALTKALDNIDSEKSLDPAYRKKAFATYQKLMQDQAYVIPDSTAITYTPVNKRLVGYTSAYDANNLWDTLGGSSNQLATK
ncbi:MAG: oligopeptide ABC transporter substrate-binding protein [Lactobacillaceae bacterium]|jgi:peptide/nickel transport system substrate-binding protein|nr:oligopeptide ABC transporter substrate-binding protein [Lactobacillaceae bacterium]